MKHLPVFMLLRQRGASTALEIRQALQITHEQVYAALVHLEATGAAAMRITWAPLEERMWVAA